MKKISIVVPVYNEENFIGGLLISIARINYPRDSYEVVVVSDGSSDRTVEVVAAFSDVRLIELKENVGRYDARKTGAEAARYPNIFFIDSRAVVDSEALAILNQIDARAVNGYVLSVQTGSLFDTFYQAVRRIVFRRFFQQYNQPVYLTLDNFDQMPKGTGVFFVEKEVLFKAYHDLAQEEMGKDSSDDTKLLKTIVKHTPILIHPGVKIAHYSRPSFWKGVDHLFARGVKFADYYCDPSLAKFWLVIVLPLLAFSAILVGLFLVPIAIWQKIVLLSGLDLVLTMILARSLRELMIILVMLPVCTGIFYGGIVRGLWIKLSRTVAIKT